MKATNKLLSLILSVALSMGVLASCDKINPPKTDSIDTNSYTANVDIRFATNDDNMKGAIDAMNASAVIMRSGADMSVVTTTQSGESAVSESYILTGGMLFHSLSARVGEQSIEENRLAFIDDANRDALIEKIGPGASVTDEDFTTKNSNDAGYTCTNILDESKASLLKMMEDRFSSIGATVELSAVTLTVETQSDVVISSVLSCDYVITLGGTGYSVTMRLYTDYDYESDVTIASPADADKYTPATLEEIVK